MTGGANPHRARWKWVQRDDFAHPDHPEWDLIQWDLEDELVKGPRKVGIPLDLGFHYVVTKGAPGLEHLPPMVVLFRITREPSGSAPGIIEGWEAWEDDDLETALLRRVRGRPVF